MNGPIDVRPVVTTDRPAVRDIWLRAISDGELPGFEAGDVDFLLSRLDADDSDMLVATVAGHVVGFVHTHARVLVVAPNHRRFAIGKRLVEAGEARAAVLVEPFQLWLPDDNPGARAFLDAVDFAYTTSLWDMRLDPAIEIPPPSFPPELDLIPVNRIDLDAYVAMFNRAFADHPSPLFSTPAIVAWAHGQPGFDPSTVNVLIDRASGELAGMIRVRPETFGGEVALIGLVPEWRGRGLGRELLRWGIARVRRTGPGAVTLSVEAANPAALALYERTGFVRTREWRRYERVSHRRPGSD